MSREARIQNMADALKLMLEDVGEHTFELSFIDSNGSRYEGILATTWKELSDRNLVREICYGCVALTGRGWRVAMINFGWHEKPEFTQKLGTLSAALKDSVKGRRNPALIGSHDLAAQTGLTREFIINVLQSKMLEEVFKIKGADADGDQVVITVPIDYGYRPL